MHLTTIRQAMTQPGIQQLLIANRFKITPDQSNQESGCTCSIKPLSLVRDYAYGTHYYLLCPQCKRIEVTSIKKDRGTVC